MLQITIITLISSAREQLGIYGYSKYGIKTFTRVWERFRIYADINELTVYTEDLMMAFMEEDCHHFSAPGTVPSYQEKMRALNKLDEFYKYNMISSNRLHCRKNYLFYGCLEKTVKSYLTYRTECISEARLQSIKLYLERFCSYTEESGVSCVNELSVSHLSGFIEFCSIYTVSTVASTACCLRGYLSYLWSAGHTELNLSYSVPKIHCRKDSEIPSAYSKDEVNHLLECVDRTNPKGKRDYAMMLLAARLGLRSSDICGLQFTSIDWELNQIHIVVQKTREPACFPLLKDVGEAIISYLKDGRPDSSDTYVFLRDCPPFTRISDGSLYTVVDKYMKRAKISIPSGKKHGPHALRHSLSSLLLENNVPLPVISEILVHKSAETTKIYLKIAEKQLLECSLHVPPINRTEVEK
jgi:integrase/recombinase XerD